MSQVFQDRTDPASFLVAAVVAEQLEAGLLDGALDLMLSTLPNAKVGFTFPAAALLPGAVLARSNDSTTAYLAIQGTTNPWQWIANCLGSLQAPVDPLDVDVSVYFGAIGAAYWSIMQQYLASAPTYAHLVFMGHSLGGAAAAYVATCFGADGFTDVQAYVLGCPRIGGSAWAAVAAPFVTALQDTDDPVPGVPPLVWGGFPSPFPWPGPPTVANYYDAGLVRTLDQSGVISAGSNGVSLASILKQAVARSAPTHLAGEYARRLRMVVQPAGIDNVTDPEALDLAWQASLPAARMEYAAQSCALDCQP